MHELHSLVAITVTRFFFQNNRKAHKHQAISQNLYLFCHLTVANRPFQPSKYTADRLNLDHFKILFSRTTFRATPTHGHIFPARARRKIVVGRADGFVVNPAADETHPGFAWFCASFSSLSRLNHFSSSNVRQL